VRGKSDTLLNRDNWNHLKSLKKHFSNVPGKYEIEELHKRAISGTAHTYCGKC